MGLVAWNKIGAKKIMCAVSVTLAYIGLDQSYKQWNLYQRGIARETIEKAQKLDEATGQPACVKDKVQQQVWDDLMK